MCVCVCVRVCVCVQVQEGRCALTWCPSLHPGHLHGAPPYIQDTYMVPLPTSRTLTWCPSLHPGHLHGAPPYIQDTYMAPLLHPTSRTLTWCPSLHHEHTDTQALAYPPQAYPTGPSDSISCASWLDYYK